MIWSMSIDFLDTTGKRIRAARDHAGLTQEEFAKRVGIRQAYISHIETGRSIAPADTLGAIARALDVSADYLLLLADDPKRPPSQAEPDAIGYSEQAEEAAKLIDGLSSESQRQYCVDMIRLFVGYRVTSGKEWAGIIENVGQVSPEAAHLISQHLLQGKPITDLPSLLDALAKSERKKPLANVN